MFTEITDIPSELDGRKLARAYVVLALARDVASTYINEKPTHAGLQPLVTMLDMTHTLLEEVLEHSMPEPVPLDSESDPASSELLM